MKTEAKFTTDGIYIKDIDGRVVILRGCNLGGDSKIPAIPAGNPLSFDVSFTGRPFPVEEADEHFERLAGWGFFFLRLVITWEAVEHAGPGIYDEDYLSYLRDILKKAESHGISVFIDPHQDVWSRWTGGDGAPGWTLEAAGFDLSKISASGAALTMQGESALYQPMCWGLNYLRYAAATMFTLFFGGNTFAPGRLVEGVPIQDWLQDHYIDAMRHTARRLKDCTAIIGFGTGNEPHAGYIGLSDLNGHGRITAPSGSAPSAFQTMAAASGFTQRAKKFALVGMLPAPGTEVLNPSGTSLFLPGFSCPWKDAGVWSHEAGVPVLKKPGYFSRADFCEDFLKPFTKKFMEVVSRKHEHYLFFTEGVPMVSHINWNEEDLLRSDGTKLNVVDALHWYDGLTLLTKKWRPWLSADSETNQPVIGAQAVRSSIRKQLARISSRPRALGVPAFLGEFGLPFDLDNRKAFQAGDFSVHEKALASYYDGIDAALLHSTIWNYSASNTHSGGDGWNTEDLSIYCAEDGGGRAVCGFSRPYAMAISGIPVAMSFDTETRVFILEWDAKPGVTEIFVPDLWYPAGWHGDFSPAEKVNAVLDEKPGERILYVAYEGLGRVTVRVQPAG